MNNTDNSRLTIRPTDADLTHLQAIAGRLRHTGKMPFATKTDAMRHALAATAAEMTDQEDAQ